MNRFCIAAAIALAASPALGDEVIFNNGDRISGTVTSSEGGKLKITSAVAGEIIVDLVDVKTFTTNGDIDLRLKNGTTVAGTPATSQPSTQPMNDSVNVAGRNVPLEQVAAINPNLGKWTGSLAAGAAVVRGNSNTSDYNAAFDLSRRTEQNRITVNGLYVLGRSEGETTKDNWYVQGQYDHFLNTKLYVYGRMRLDRDNVADLTYRLSPGVGVGYQWFSRPVDKFNFNTEAGLTYIYEKYSDPDSLNNYLAGRLAYHFDVNLLEKLAFVHNFEYLPSLTNLNDFIVNTDAGLRYDLTDHFFLEGKVVVNYNNEPANEDVSKTDQKYLIAVGYKF